VIPALPTSSTNVPPITGTWSPAISNTATTTYTFTPTAGLCASPTNLTITITPNVTPTFASVGPYCSGATIPALPTTSNEGITGTWSPAISNTATGTYTFTPTVGQCATTTTLTITITPLNTAGTPSSNPTLCINTALTPITIATTGATGIGAPTGLPAGVTAVWSNNVITISGTPSAAGTFNYSIPLTGGCGNVNATGTIIVNPAPEALAAAPIIPPCVGATLQLLATAVPGATYSWSGPNLFTSSLEDPVINNVQANAEGQYQLIVNLNGCRDTAIAFVQIDDPIAITLNYPDSPYCILETEGLPTTSWTGTGAYTSSPAGLVIDSDGGVIDPSSSNPGTYTVTLSPLGCALPVNATVVILQSITPTFNPISTICYQTSVPTLPATSTNGITGTWNPATISNTASGTYTFTPNPNQCAVPATLDATVAPQVIVDGIYHD
jgi:hypothetical protein